APRRAGLNRRLHHAPHSIGRKRKTGMKSWVFRGMLTAAIALPALSGAARAGGNDDFGCSNATLKGLYAFGATNYTLPRVVAGMKVFDGNGNLPQSEYRGYSTPAEFAPKGQETGTYPVNSDCTGSMVMNLNAFGVPPVTTQGGMIGILFVISDGGR